MPARVIPGVSPQPHSPYRGTSSWATAGSPARGLSPHLSHQPSATAPVVRLGSGWSHGERNCSSQSPGPEASRRGPLGTTERSSSPAYREAPQLLRSPAAYRREISPTHSPMPSVVPVPLTTSAHHGTLRTLSPSAQVEASSGSGYPGAAKRGPTPVGSHSQVSIHRAATTASSPSMFVGSPQLRPPQGPGRSQSPESGRVATSPTPATLQLSRGAVPTAFKPTPVHYGRSTVPASPAPENRSVSPDKRNQKATHGSNVVTQQSSRMLPSPSRRLRSMSPAESFPLQNGVSTRSGIPTSSPNGGYRPVSLQQNSASKVPSSPNAGQQSSSRQLFQAASPQVQQVAAVAAQQAARAAQHAVSTAMYAPASQQVRSAAPRYPSRPNNQSEDADVELDSVDAPAAAAASGSASAAALLRGCEGDLDDIEDVELRQGVPIRIGDFDCVVGRPLGQGSFGTVWAAEAEGRKGLAIKEIPATSQEELYNAHFEAHLLEVLGREVGCPDELRIPSLVACERKYISDVNGENWSHWRVRLAMTLIPGEPLDDFMASKSKEKKRLGAEDLSRHTNEALLMAREMLLQLAPTMEHISKIALHRDVNAHNILIEIGEDRSPSYGLVDFGLAVNELCWRMEKGSASSPSRPSRTGQDGTCTWHHLDVGGDCRYWPVSAWIQFLHGYNELVTWPALCTEYQTLLDLHSLGVTTVQLLVQMLPPLPEDSLHAGDGSWSRALSGLQRAWTAYWETVSPLHRNLMHTFHNNGDWDRLKRQCIDTNQRLAVEERLREIRRALREVKESSLRQEVGGPGLVPSNPHAAAGLCDALLLMIGVGLTEDQADALEDFRKECSVEDRLFGRIYEVMAKRRDTFAEDIGDIRHVLKNARSTSSVLSMKLQELDNATLRPGDGGSASSTSGRHQAARPAEGPSKWRAVVASLSGGTESRAPRAARQPVAPLAVRSTSSLLSSPQRSTTPHQDQRHHATEQRRHPSPMHKMLRSALPPPCGLPHGTSAASTASTPGATLSPRSQAAAHSGRSLEADTTARPQLRPAPSQSPPAGQRTMASSSPGTALWGGGNTDQAGHGVPRGGGLAGGATVGIGTPAGYHNDVMIGVPARMQKSTELVFPSEQMFHQLQSLHQKVNDIANGLQSSRDRAML